jgi:pyruvate kinase
MTPYEIVATLGPVSAQPETWHQMLAAGATAFRLNTSHLTLEALDGWLERMQAFLAQRDLPHPPLVLDLQGSKWRLGRFTPFDLAPGRRVDLILADAAAGAGVLPVPHADFFRAAGSSGGEIVLNDAKIRLELETADAERVQARVTQGGPIAPNKGVTFASSAYRVESLSEKDRAIVLRAGGLGFIRFAVSYVRDAAEMAGYRALVQVVLGQPGYLIAKLERRPAVDQPAEIAQHADELWLCRGDLGAELGLRGMAEAAYALSQQVSALPVPVLLAGQVLEHMTTQPTPTRSEITTLHDALARGYRGFVLSDETAVGLHPVESCRTAALFQPAAAK